MKRLVVCGVVALSLVGLMVVARRESSETVIKYENRDYNDNRRTYRDEDEYRSRGPVRGAVDGASDIARGTGHAVGHTIKNIFGGRRSDHRGFYDSRGDYHR